MAVSPVKGYFAAVPPMAAQELVWVAIEIGDAANDPPGKVYLALHREISASFPICARLHHVGIFLKVAPHR
jgi:hypothetical protein